MPNFVAYFALVCFPLFTLGFFKKKPVASAAFLTLLIGLLVLPAKVGFDMPVYDLDKNSIAALTAMFGCLFIAKHKIYLVPRSGKERWFILLYLLLPIFTVLTNREPYGSNGGFGLYDWLVETVRRSLGLIPFLLGLQLIKTRDDHLMIFKYLFVATLIYSLPTLWEIRMSPQLHSQLYGFFPHEFKQQIRNGGFRAVVFLGHGLLVAMLIATALGAGVILWKEKIKTFKINSFYLVIFLFLVLLISKTVGALLLGTLLLVFIAWAPTVLIRYMAVFLAGLVIFYPLLCIMDLFPHEQIVDAITTHFGADRAESLKFRFTNEAMLLEHAQNKILFGWGSSGRFFIPEAIPDGVWIILLGSSGILGYVAIFGLVVFCVLRATRVSKQLDNEADKRLLLAHALMVSVVLVDQIPNSSIGGMHPLYWFLIGGLLGRVNAIVEEQKQVESDEH